MSDAPYFPFFTKDWLSAPEITMMTPAQEGAYIRLLAISWSEGAALPADKKKIMRLSRLTDAEDLNPVLEQFEKRDDGYVNLRLEREYNKMVEKSEKRRAAARVRWCDANAMQMQCKRNANAMQTQCYSDPDSDLDKDRNIDTKKYSIYDNNKKNNNKNTKKNRDTKTEKTRWLRDCAKVWFDLFPKKTEPHAAKRAFVELVPRIARSKRMSYDKVVEFLNRRTGIYAAAKEGAPIKFLKNPTNWLHDGCYDEDEAVWHAWKEREETPRERREREIKERGDRISREVAERRRRDGV